MRRVNRIRQEERSENPPAFGDIDDFAECQELPRLFYRTIKEIRKGEAPDKSDLHTCVLWLAGTLMLVNHQRPGAVVNMMLSELRYASTWVLDSLRDRLLANTSRYLAAHEHGDGLHGR